MFILNTAHKVYHNEDCHYVRMMKEGNKQVCENKPTYARPCSCCKPEQTFIFQEMSEVSVWDEFLEE